MISLQNLTIKQQSYLTILLHFTFPELDINEKTLNSLKPGVLQYALKQKNLPKRKHKVISQIIDKIIIKPIILDGELLVNEENKLN